MFLENDGIISQLATECGTQNWKNPLHNQKVQIETELEKIINFDEENFFKNYEIGDLCTSNEKQSTIIFVTLCD